MQLSASYGTWTSPVTPEVLVENVVGLGYPSAAGSALWWLESRPSEGGRQVLVRRDPDGSATDVLPDGMSARTLVHEYGGLCHAVDAGRIFFSNYADQRIYRLEDAGGVQPITPESDGQKLRYADFSLSPDGRWLICVREQHRPDGVVNDIVAVPTDGSEEPRVVAEGRDFFAAPRLDPAGRKLAWLSWDHPQMPWDGTELSEAAVDGDCIVNAVRTVAGGPSESVTQPRYSPDGVLHYISDRSGWWNIYSDTAAGPRPAAPMAAEFSGPDWGFGQSTYTFLPDGCLAVIWSKDGLDHLGILAPGAQSPQEIQTGFSSIGSIGAAPAGVVAIAGSATQSPAVVHIDLPEGRVEVVKAGRATSIPDRYLSTPRPIEFPSGDGLTAHALFYPPRNADFTPDPGEKPPLLVMSHGGPTGATSSTLNYKIQFWTSRGIAVVDVNYSGSTGYGRAYRDRLKGAWGVADVDDCVNAARWLAGQGEVDRRRLMIRGGSAGGFTTLCALTFYDDFACGASLYGVADACALAEDTHKFEARYLDGLIGPWPQARDLYEQRSPIFHTERLRTPLILFQGLEDEIVPPRQSQMVAEALRKHGVPHAYLEFEGEQHGFRKAETIKRTAEAELSFYGQILGFEPADDLEPVSITR
ncbi:MAG: S9 family peptidase [Actinomycetota bacterium]